MPVAGVGIDIIDINRMKRMRKKYGLSFLTKVFTDTEIEICLASRRPDQMFAARFAAKEATMKALGAGLFSGVRFKDIEIEGGSMAKPTVRVHDRAAQAADLPGPPKVFISITHEKDYAAAVAIIEG
jgi:holo-[acyl-carrier protein] synthase